MPEIRRPILGSWHVLTGRAIAVKIPIRGSAYSRGNNFMDLQRRWRPIEIVPGLDAMYVGWRTVRNGIIHQYFEGSSDFEFTESVEVWLFVVNERQNPIHVFPDQVEWTPNE